MVDQDRMAVTPQGMLILPLSRAASRRIDITLPLRRSIGRDTSRLELPLPVPSADSVGTGDLVVRASPNLEVLPDLSNSVGLAAPPDTQQVLTAPENGATELHFRTLLPAVTFAADRTRRAGETSNQVSTEVQLAQDSAEVEERISYSVRFEPLSELGFEIPAELAPEARGLDIELLPAREPGDSHLDDTSTPLHVSPSEDDSASDQTSVKQIRVMLPRPQIGKFFVRMRYHIALQRAGMADTEWPIPLVQPTDGESKPHAANVYAPRNISLSLNDNDEETTWKADSTTSESHKSTYSFRADGPVVSLPLVARQGRSDLPASTIVERVWLQTWLANGVEQDRAAFRLRTTAGQATVELPPDLPSNEFETLVDRKPAEVLSQAHGRLVVRLPVSSANASNDNSGAATVHTLELRSRQPAQGGLLQEHRFTPSQVEGSMALSQVYWQVIVPGDEHIIQQPAQLLPAGAWQWLGSFWGRKPLKTQSELEEWVGASRQIAPTESESQYLYTGLLPISTIEIAIAPRWLVVLVASSSVLLVALALLYIPRSQRRWLLIAIVCLLLLVSIAYPEAALLLGQAAILGLLLSGISVLLSRSVRRPRLPLSPPITTASSRQAITPRAESKLMPPAMSNASTAPTATLRMAESKQ
jgi:hypothetical protein